MDAVLVRVIGEIIAKLCFELRELRFHLRIKCSSVPTLFVETTTSFLYTYLYGNLYSGMCVCVELRALTRLRAHSHASIIIAWLGGKITHYCTRLGPLTVGTVRGAVCVCAILRRR